MASYVISSLGPEKSQFLWVKINLFSFKNVYLLFLKFSIVLCRVVFCVFYFVSFTFL
jgi:hypothetical protein